MKQVFKFDYGQTVVVTDSAPASVKPGTQVDVVGMMRLTDKRTVAGQRCQKGTEVYLIEYEDGSSVELQGACLELLCE